MIPIELRNGVRLLKAQGQSLREISRLLKVSRNAVRRILREKDRQPRAASPPCDAATLARLEDAFKRARQYDAIGDATAAIKEYDKAAQWLPPDDPNREIARGRAERLRSGVK